MALTGYVNALREVFGLTAGEHWCELVPDGILCLDGQWRLLFLNRAAQEMFGLEGNVVIGETARRSALLWGLLQELHLDSLVVPEQQRGTQHQVRGVTLRRGNDRQVVEVSASVSWRGGRRVFTLVTRGQTPNSGEQQALYQSQKRQVIGALAGGIAHDFNNILTAIIGNLDLVLSEEDLPMLSRQSLLQALESARRGAELNTKLLAFSRQTDVHPVAVDVARLIEETVFILRRSIDPRVRIKFPAPPADLWPAWVDEGQFMQVLMNLCLNARDAMPKGGDLSFKLANRVFAASEATPLRQTGEFVQVIVADTGVGMTPEVLERLFEPYFTTKEFGRGAGLGLSIANHVVVENGGWMEVESEPDKGSRFHIFLPRTRTAVAAATARAAPRAASGAVLEGKETVLLVDDEQSVRTVVHAVLSYRGYTVTDASDGAEALEKFREARGAIQLVLLDIQMPEMNGWDTLDRIRELDPDVPVLLLSGGASDPPADRTSQNEAAGILHKPFASAELLRAIRGILDQTESQGQSD